MQLFEPLAQSGIIDRINKICSTTNESYANARKIANVNDGLDEYFHLASLSAEQGTLDDTGRSSKPIETQDLVSGTNNYKVASFTNEVLNILRVAALHSDGTEYDLVYVSPQDIEDWGQFFDTGVSGAPQYWSKLGDYIFLAPNPNYASTSGLKCYVNRVLSRFSFTSFTVTIAAPGVFTATAHGLVNSDAVVLVTDGALPTGLTADTTIYYVTKVDADSFKLSTTPALVGGTYITTTGTQSGTHKFVKVNASPGIPSIHHKFLAMYASDVFMDAKHPNFQKNRADMQMMEKKVQEYWASAIRPSKTVIGINKRPFR